MREEDGARYLSPLVKQDLAKLDTDGDTRRLAVQSLKLFVEQLDASTLPRFISQIAESREPGATRSYAISLYEEVARVHGKLVVPHIPKVMAALIRCSSASGSFPQLQVACARVTAALARHGIDSTTSQEEAEEIMREICTPLVDALAGKLEPVAANAAACIHALVETEKWKYVREEVVHEACQRTTVALSERPTRTAAHMQLIRILASVNPDVVSLHGASLLRAGEEILKVTANSWQLRKAAAQLLQSVLTILDKEALETELNSALHALDSCRLDKMPHVRAAVSEALHTAKLLASGSGATYASFGMAASPIRKATDRSSWLHDDHMLVSPVSKRGTSPRTPIRSRTSTFSPRAASVSPRATSPTSQESRRLSFSPTSTSTSGYSVQASSPAKRKGGARANRAPLYPARTGGGNVHSPRSNSTAGTSPPSSTTTVEECESPSRRLNVRILSGSTGVNGNIFAEGDEAGHDDNYLRPLARLSSDAFTPGLPNQLDILSVGIQKLKEGLLSDEVGTDALPLDLGETELSIMEHNIFTGEDSVLAQFVSGYEDTRPARLDSTSSHVELVLPRLKLGTTNSMDQQSGLLDHTSEDVTPVLKASSISLQTVLTLNNSEIVRSDSMQESSYEDESANADVEVEKREICTRGIESPHEPQLKLSSKHHYNGLGHNLALEKTTQRVSTAKGFPLLVTPKRLVRSLSNLSIPDLRRSSVLEQDKKLAQDDPLLTGMTSTTAECAGDLEVETPSKAGWSVRDNPIASEESYSDDEFEARRGRGDYDFDFPKPSLMVDFASPREIRMISPAEKMAQRSFDDVSTLDLTSHGEDHITDAEDHPCPSCILAEQTFTSCRARTPCQPVKSMQPPSGLSSLLHQDETKCELSNLCPDCVCQTKSGDEPVKEELSNCTSSLKEPERRNEKGLVGMVSQNWKRICWYTEAALGGSLCLVIALPLAMVIARALSGSRECHLVPT